MAGRRSSGADNDSPGARGADLDDNLRVHIAACREGESSCEQSF